MQKIGFYIMVINKYVTKSLEYKTKMMLTYKERKEVRRWQV